MYICISHQNYFHMIYKNIYVHLWVRCENSKQNMNKTFEFTVESLTKETF